MKKLWKKIINFKLNNLGVEMSFEQVMDELEQKEQELNKNNNLKLKKIKDVHHRFNWCNK